MPSRTVIGFALALLCLAPLPAARADAAQADDPLAEVPPLPALAAFAREHDIPLSGVDLAPVGAAGRLGDQVTMLVTASIGAGYRQWIARIASAPPEGRESDLPPLNDQVVFTTTGLELRYPVTLAPLQVWLIGPFGSGGDSRPAQDLEAALGKPRRVLVSPEFLDFGLDRYSRVARDVVRRAAAAGVDQPFYDFDDHPFPEEALKKGRAYAQAVGLTPDEERVEVGAYMALGAFVDIASRLPGFRLLALHVMKRPTLWSIVRHFGIQVGTHFQESDVALEPRERTGVSLPVYRMPFRVVVNDEASLDAVLAVASPRPPLRVCAGIIGISAHHPDDPGQRLLIRLLAARPGRP